MKKFITPLLLVALLAALMAVTACDRGGGAEPAEDPPAQVELVATPTPPPVMAEAGEDADAEVEEGDPRLAQHGLDENLRFLEPQPLSIAMWCRSPERMPDITESYWAEWVQRTVLADHNIDASFVAIPRWDEGPFLTTLLGAGDAPDVSFSFNFGIIETFAGMGAVLDLSPLLATYNDWLPNLYGLLTPDNVYWNLNRQTGELWALAGRLIADGRILTFVREDWLNTLNMDSPTNLAEFEAMLEAFRDNAELLLGEDAHRMVPYIVGADVAWSAGLMIDSFLPNQMTERDWFVYGFCGRRMMHHDASRETYRIWNRWFNENLLFQEFAYGEAGLVEDLKRLGFAGAFTGNWDLPFRAVDRIITDMQANVGPEANFIPVVTFPNEAGINVKYMPAPTDRSIFFPHTNQNPVASLLYVDWISRASVREFLAFGIEGIHRETLPNGAIMSLAEGDIDEDPDAHRFPDNMLFGGLRNFDIAITVNGIDLGDPETTLLTLSLAYPGIEPEAILYAREMGLSRARVWRRIQTRTIEAQEGMTVPLDEFRDTVLHNAITAAPGEFDRVWDTMYAQYLAMGGQAIIDERRQAWYEFFGDNENMPGWEGW